MRNRRLPALTGPAGGFALAVLATLASAPASAQTTQFLETSLPRGQPVAPFFEGWYANPDGTYTFSFGYFNFNTDETVHIPLGPDNRIEPGRFDGGMQPTIFPTEPNQRDRGSFTVTVPGDFGETEEPVVWYLTAHGTTYSVPGRIGVDSYQLDNAPRAGGSVPPLIGFEPGGARGRSPTGIMWDEHHRARVGRPLTLTVFASDPSPRPDDATRPDAGVDIPIGFTWFTHQGPAPATFEDSEHDVMPPSEGAEISWTTSVRFSEPGEYMLRVRADNWTARDSSGGDQCCWSNGYVRVTVTE